VSGRLENKVAVVTGCARGIGHETVKLMVAQGASVVGVDIDAADDTIAQFKTDGLPAEYQTGDVTSQADWERILDFTVEKFGRLDILVNNAGIGGSTVGPPDGLEGWERLLQVNATSVFIGTTAAVARMIPTGGGSVVNVSSIMGIVGGDVSHPGYHAAKAATRNYSKAAAVRFGPSGVRVNSVHPGYLPAMRGANPSQKASSSASKIPLTPLRRTGESIEVAYGIVFLASDEASFISGTELVIDGGFLAQ